MKKLILFFLAALLMAACATQNLTPEEKAAKRQAKKEEVARLIESKHFVTPMRTMHSAMGTSKSIDFGYRVTVKGDTLISYLPYLGRAHNLSYGSDEGLNFTAAITEYRIDRPRKDANRVQLLGATKSSLYIYTFLIYDDGSVQLSVQSRDKEAVSFDGEIEAYKED